MFLYPTPDEEGIAKTKKLYLNRFNLEISDDQASEVLSRVMRYIYLISEQCPDTPSTLESPKTTRAES